jgi:hypothetical protein
MSHFSKYILGAIASILFFACTKPESSASDPTLYKSLVFDEVSKETVIYSDTFGFEMDIYWPTNDESQNRPVVFLGHGGGFYFGSKENPAMVHLAEKFAKRGYVAVAFNYHLASGLPDILDSVKAASLVMKAIGDARAAIRYMRKHQVVDNRYGIDPNRFFIGGNSAGAILATHIGFFSEYNTLSPFLDSVMNANGGYHGFSGNAGYSSQVNGVFNLAGGIISLKLIDNMDPPIYNAHGMDDDVVPLECDDVYQVVTAGSDVINLCGSVPIHNKAQLNDVPSTLNIVQGKHVPWLDQTTGEPNEMFESIEQDIVNFLYNLL